MSFLIVTQVKHSFHEGKYYSYAPYVQEMNIWLKKVDHVLVLAPLQGKGTLPSAIDLAYEHSNITFYAIPEFHASRLSGLFHTISAFFLIFRKTLNSMRKAEHIHLRCPGNVGLIGCLAQLFFPSKKKTAKYAGNWDWNSKQPFSYRLQQRILRNTFLTRNMTALVYGEWPDLTKNTKAFFTATYKESEITAYQKSAPQNQINLCFVGTLTENKRPHLTLEVGKELMNQGHKVHITFCGDGPLASDLKTKAKELSLGNSVSFLGKVNKGSIKTVFQQSHFLIFMSRSEGWPKAVAEAMFWGCIPITTSVSCVPQMLGVNGERGFLVEIDQMEKAASLIANSVNNSKDFLDMGQKATQWSRHYTLDLFEEEVTKLL